eukprot:NODE_5827_length_962_cov_40.038141_g5244_i0.p1 GENE.NODE_5827_length_962_cov_40.038141_g5244_i0~~NODE_5827_length_962_cov_40.038141_g5244_i0.p1  ORF type:complete len:284 (+),score=52.32 NODE_5827_length_962_cov_40.038141_g5244_i0:63-914(+)
MIGQHQPRTREEKESDPIHLFIISPGIYLPQYIVPKPLVILRSSLSPTHPCIQWEGLSSCVLRNSNLQHVFVLDFAALGHELSKEYASPGLGPVTKPVARILSKLNAENLTLVALSGTCGLAIKLAVCALGSTISSVVFVQPQPLQQCVRSKQEDKIPKATLLFGNPEISESIGSQYKPYFNEFNSLVVPLEDRTAIMNALVSQLIPEFVDIEDQAVPKENQIVTEEDYSAHELRFSELVFSLDLKTRQQVEEVDDITEKVLETKKPKEKPKSKDKLKTKSKS